MILGGSPIASLAIAETPATLEILTPASNPEGSFSSSHTLTITTGGTQE